MKIWRVYITLYSHDADTHAHMPIGAEQHPAAMYVHTCGECCCKSGKALWSPQTAMRLIHSVPKQICTWRRLCFTQYSEHLAQHNKAQFWQSYKLKSPRPFFFFSVFFRIFCTCLLCVPSLTLAGCLPLSCFFIPFYERHKEGLNQKDRSNKSQLHLQVAITNTLKMSIKPCRAV